MGSQPSFVFSSGGVTVAIGYGASKSVFARLGRGATVSVTVVSCAVSGHGFKVRLRSAAMGSSPVSREARWPL